MKIFWCFSYLSDKVGDEHDNVRSLREGLSGREVSNSLSTEFLVCDDFNDRERSPSHVVSAHVQLSRELECRNRVRNTDIETLKAVKAKTSVYINTCKRT